MGSSSIVGGCEANLAARMPTLVPSCRQSWRQHRYFAVCVGMIIMIDGLAHALLLHLACRQRGCRTSKIPQPQSRFMFALTHWSSKCSPSSPTASTNGAIVRPGHVAIDASSLADNVQLVLTKTAFQVGLARIMHANMVFLCLKLFLIQLSHRVYSAIVLNLISSLLNG